MLPEDIQLEDAISTTVDYSNLLYESISTEDQLCDDEDNIALVANDTPSTSGTSEGSRASKRSKIIADPVQMSEQVNASAPSPAKKMNRQHTKRKRIRAENIAENGYHANDKVTRKHLANTIPVKTTFDTANSPVAHGAYTALNKPAPQNPKDIPIIQKIMEEDSEFQYIECDTNDTEKRKPRPIVDSRGYIIAHVAPPPVEQSYSRDTQDLVSIFVEESQSDTFSSAELDHKRGDFPAVNFGFTLPNGFKEPINLNYSRHVDKVERIRNSAGFKQISCLQNALLSFWYPGMYDYQKRCVDRILERHPDLIRVMPKTIFPTTACNFRNVCCYKHRDTQNCPFGWCCITALGNYDHTQGGHLILWELKLIIEFPHGWTILIPSATITHSNTPVSEGETRFSITQYCAGGLLHYADNLFSTDKALRKKNPKLYEENQAKKYVRWRKALSLLSTIDDLKQRKRPHVPFFH